MSYTLVFEGRTRKTLDGLEASLRYRILRKLDDLQADPRPSGAVKMAGADDLYRVRVGDWRIVYAIRDRALVLVVVRHGHRCEVYR